MVFDAAPGAGVTLGLCDLGDRLRFVSNEVEVVPVPFPMPKLPVARAVWRPLPEFATSTECWLAAGGPHHTVLSTQLGVPHLEYLADMVGIELCLIDRDTTVRGFHKELRWSAAYHRLAAGL
jgi:L-arabinose isomerase